MGRLQNSLRSLVQKPPSFTFFADSWVGSCLLAYQKKGSKSIFFPGTVFQLWSAIPKVASSRLGCNTETG